MAIGIWGKPAQLDIQPYDKEFMLRAADAVQKRADIQETELSNLSGIASTIQGGYATQERAKAYRDKIQNQVNSLYEEMQKSGNLSGGAYKIKQIANQIKSDPEYLTIKQDEAAKEYAATLRLDPGFKNHVQDFYNPNSGWTQRQGNFDPSWYQSVAPGKTEEFKPYFDRIKATITKEYADQGIPVSSYVDSKGLTHIKNAYTGEIVKTITPDKVYGMFKNLAEKDPSFQGLQTFNYDQARFNQEAKIAGYDQTWQSTNPSARMAEIATANYLGYQQDREETSPIYKDEITGIADQTGSASGTKGTKPEDLYPNPATDALQQLNNTGEADVKDIDALAYMVGGSQPNKEKGTFNLNLTGKKAFFSVTDPTKSPEESKQNSDLINIGGAYKALKDKTLKSWKNISNAASERAKKEYPGYVISYDYETSDEGPNAPLSLTINKREGTGANAHLKTIKTISSKELENYAFEGTSEYKDLLKLASEKGIDITKPEFYKQVETIASDPKSQLMADLSTGVQSLKGTVNFRPLSSGTLYAGNTGEPILSGTAEVTQQQLINMLSPNDTDKGNKRIQQAMEAGLVVLTEPASDKKPAKYEISINTPVKLDVEGSTQAYFGNSAAPEHVRKQATAQQQEASRIVQEETEKNLAYQSLKPVVEKDLQKLNDHVDLNLTILSKYDKSTADFLQKEYQETIKMVSSAPDLATERKAYAYLYKILSRMREALVLHKEQPIELGKRPGGSGTLAPAYYE